MSFDFALISGDLDMLHDGTMRTVSDTQKLRQDILKIILTTIGSNRFHPWYGCSMSDDIIGSNLPDNIVISDIRAAVTQSIDRLKKLQQQQQASQKVSLAELINSVGSIDVYRAPEDYRQIKVMITIYTKRLTKIETTFTLEA